MSAPTITRGRVSSAKKIVIYGPEGIGKSSLGAKFPKPLFIDTEDGTGELDVDRIVCADWRATEAAVRNFPDGYATCVIDTADWAERALIEWFLKSKGIKSIEDVGYGKGYTQVAELWTRFLADLDALVARGINVVFIAHSKVTRVSPPDQTDGYDRYELKLSKQSVGPTKEWAQMVLFVNFQMNLVEGTDGKVKAQGGKNRVMYATHSAAWDAKNRFDLPDELPMSFDSIAHIFGASPAKADRPAQQTPPTKETPPAEPASPSEPADVITAEQIEKLELYRKNSVGKPIIDDALRQIEGIDVGDLSGTHAAELIVAIQTAMNGAPAGKAPTLAVHVSAATAAWLDQNAEKVEAYLVRVQWLKAGQKWRELSFENQHKIEERADAFAVQAGVPKRSLKAA